MNSHNPSYTNTMTREQYLNQKEFVPFRISRYIFILGIAFVIALMFYAQGVEGVECNSTIGTTSCTVSASLTLSGGVYYYNSTGTGTTDGVMYISGSNLVLDGNGSTLIGNGSGAGIYQTTTARANVTIKNITFVNYYRGMFIRNEENSTFRDLTVYNSTTYGLLFRNIDKSLIYNNRIFGNSSNTAVGLQSGISLDSASDYNNVTNNFAEKMYWGFYLTGVSSNYFSNNVVNNSYYGYIADVGLINNSFSNSIINNASVSIRLRSGYNNSILNNYINKYLLVGFQLSNETNSNVSGNALIGLSPFVNGTQGILLQANSTLNKIESNNLNFSTYAIWLDSGSVYNNISFNSVYNTTWSSITDSNFGNSINTRATANFNQFFNNSVYNSGWNAFDIDSSYNFIYYNYVTGSNHGDLDFYDSSYSSSDSNYNLVYRNTFVNSLGNSIVSIAGGNNNFTNNFISSNSPYTGIVNQGNSSINKNNYFFNNTIANYCDGIFSSSNNSIYLENSFINISCNVFYVKGESYSNYNDTSVYQYNFVDNGLTKISVVNNTGLFNYYPRTDFNSLFINSSKSFYSISISLFNQSNALFHNGTNLCTGSSSNIADNDGNINITLLPSGSCYVLDNFNLTEGTTRTNSPLSITSLSVKAYKDVYTLDSTLSQSVNDVLFVPLNQECPLDVEVGGTSQSFTCDGEDLSTITISTYDSNQFELELLYATVTDDTCTDINGIGSKLFKGLGFFFVFAILGGAAIYLFVAYGGGEFDWFSLVLYGSLALLIAFFFTVVLSINVFEGATC